MSGRIPNLTSLVKKELVVAVLGVFVWLIILQIQVLSVNRIRYNHTILGLRLEHHSTTVLSSAALNQAVKNAIQTKDKQPIEIKAQNYSGKVSARQLGAHYDQSIEVYSLLRMGREGNFWHQVKVQDLALIGRVNRSIGFQAISSDLASKYIATVKQKVDRQAVNAHFQFQNNTAAVVSEQAGVAIDAKAALTQIEKYDPVINGATIQLPVNQLPADITAADAQSLLPNVQEIISQPMVVQAEDKNLTLGQEQLLSLITIVKAPDPGHPTKQVVKYEFDTEKIGKVLDGLAQQVTVGARPKIVSAGGLVRDQGSEGAHVDGPHATVAVLTGLTQRSSEVKAGKQPTKTVVTIVVDKVQPLVVALANPQANQTPAYVKNQPTVTLTLDDGPNATYTEKALDILKHYGVHATFYLVGRNTLAYPNVAKRIVQEGHQVGNHSFTHPDLSRLSQPAVAAELDNTQKAINDTVGITPFLFRPPFGALSAQVRSAVDARKLTLTAWTIDPQDWAQPGSAEITRRVLAGLSPGGNILLHVLHQQTVDALPSIIEGIRARGYTFN